MSAEEGENIQERILGLEHQLSEQTTPLDRLTACCALASCYAFEDDLEKAQKAIQLSKSVKEGPAWARCSMLYTEGMVMLRKRQFTSAKMKFSQIQREDPNFMLSYLGLAAVHLETKKYRDAFGAYKVVLEGLGTLAPTSTRIGLALCCLHLNQIDHARKCLERALDLVAEDVLALRTLFVVCLKQRDLSRLSSVIMKLFELDKEDPLIITRYVDVLFLKAEKQGSLQQYEAVQLDLIEQTEALVETDPKHLAYCQFQRGRLHHVASRWAQAKDHYTLALNVLGDLVPARIGLAKVLHHLNEDAPCFEQLQRLAVDASEDEDVLSMLVHMYSTKGQHEQAAKVASKLAKTQAAGTSHIWYLAGYANRLDTHQFDKFLRTAIRIAETEGKEADWTVMANLASANNDVNGVGDVVRKVFETMEIDEITASASLSLEHAPLLLDFARLCRAGDPAGARKLCIFVARHHPGLPDPFYLLHHIARQENRQREAITWMNVLLGIDEANPYATIAIADMYLQSGISSAGRRAYNVLNHHRHLSRTLVPLLARAVTYLREAQRSGQQGQLAEAMIRFKSVLKEDPGNLMAAHGLACCLALLGDSNGATLLLQRVLSARPNSEAVQKNVALHQIMAQIKSGNYRTAVNLYSSFTQGTSTNYESSARHKSTLAFARMSLKEFEEAAQLLAEASEEAQREGDEGTMAMLEYNRAILLTNKVVEQLSECNGLSAEEGDALKQSLHTALETAKKAAEMRYKQDGPQAVQFMRELIAEMPNLERERRRQVNRGLRHRNQATTLDNEWQQTAKDYHERQEAEAQLARGKELEVQRLRAERSQAQLERVQELVATWHPTVMEEEEVLPPAAEGEGEIALAEEGEGEYVPRKRARDDAEEMGALEAAAILDAAEALDTAAEGYEYPAETLDVNALQTLNVDATVGVGGGEAEEGELLNLLATEEHEAAVGAQTHKEGHQH